MLLIDGMIGARRAHGRGCVLAHGGRKEARGDASSEDTLLVLDPPLERVLASPHVVAALVTPPDKPKGRGMKV